MKSPNMAMQLCQGCSSYLGCSSKRFPNPGMLGADCGHTPSPSTFPLEQGGPRAGQPPDPERVERASIRKRSGVAFSFRQSACLALCHLEISRHQKPMRFAGWFVGLHRRNPLSKGKLFMGNGAR